AEPDLHTVMDRDVGKVRSGGCPQVHVSARQRSQLLVPADEVGVKVGFDDVFDAKTVPDSLFDIDSRVALRVDHRGNSFTSDQIRSVRQTAQVELLKVHESPRWAIVACAADCPRYNAIWPKISLPRHPAPWRRGVFSPGCCCCLRAAAPRR